jgi:hypothetical protein
MATTRSTAKNLRTQLLLGTSENDVATLAYGLINPKTKDVALQTNRQGGVKQFVEEQFVDYDTADSVSVIGIGGATFATTTALVHHMRTPAGVVYGLANIGVQTTIPVMAAAGLDIKGVQTTGIGTEIFSNFVGASGSPFCVGFDKAFYFRVSITVANASGAAVLIAGFRKAEVNVLSYLNYTEYAAIGAIAGGTAAAAINTSTKLNSGSTVATITGNTWADAATKVFEIRVSYAGVVSYLINGAPPTTVASPAIALTDGVQVIPFVVINQFTTSTDVTGVCTINSWEFGYQ